LCSWPLSFIQTSVLRAHPACPKSCDAIGSPSQPDATPRNDPNHSWARLPNSRHWHRLFSAANPTTGTRNTVRANEVPEAPEPHKRLQRSRPTHNATVPSTLQTLSACPKTCDATGSPSQPDALLATTRTTRGHAYRTRFGTGCFPQRAPLVGRATRCGAKQFPRRTSPTSCSSGHDCHNRNMRLCATKVHYRVSDPGAPTTQSSQEHVYRTEELAPAAFREPL